jgi:hypothetical protein
MPVLLTTKIMKKSIILFLFLSLSFQGGAQNVFITRNGKISFHSKTNLENIDATNNEVFSALDILKGDLAFAVLIKGFHFDRALMEEHFNENYLESTRFPKATFSGKIQNLSEVTLLKDGQYPVQVEGDMTIHGVTKKIVVQGEIVVQGGKVSSKATFKLVIKDFNIQVPGVVSEKIAEVVDVVVDCSYQPKSN